MIKLFQKFSFFYISKFEAASKAMKQSGKQPWVEKISKDEKRQLWALYKQATQGDYKQKSQSQQQNQFQNQGQTSGEWGKSGPGKMEVQGASKQGSFGQQGQQGQQTQSQMSDKAKMQTQGSTQYGQGSSTMKNQPGYGSGSNMTQNASDKAKQGMDFAKTDDKDNDQAWQKYKGKSKQQAQTQYVKLARDLLKKHGAQKYIKDF